MGPQSASAAHSTPFGVHLAVDQREVLEMRRDDSRLVVSLRAATLDRAAVSKWLDRHNLAAVASLDGLSPAMPCLPLVHLPTTVICFDSRVAHLAALYARTVGARLSFPSCRKEISATIERLEKPESVSIILLSDRLDQALCQAIWDGNALRVAAGRPPISYGFLSAFTAEQLGWLMVKTWALLLQGAANEVTFGRWDLEDGRSAVLTHRSRGGATSLRAVDSPWLDESVTVLGVRAHGAPFDLSLGDTVLCGHLEPALPADRMLKAPTCFHDGVCFRLGRSPEAPTRRVTAVAATPLVWCLDSCATIPFAANAFGDGTSYVFGLVAGAAVGVIGPFLDIATQGGLNAQSEALLATGTTLGQVAASACEFAPGQGFDRFLLIGSPDIKLLPLQRLLPTRRDDKLLYRVKQNSQVALRLGLPADFDDCPFVVADDGGQVWASAQCYCVREGPDRDLLITFNDPVDLDGWLLVGAGGKSRTEFKTEAGRLRDNLNILPTYPFVDPKAEAIEHCRSIATALLAVIEAPRRLRSRIDTAQLSAELLLAVDGLHRLIAGWFLAEVASKDFSLDRVPGLGFDVGRTKRVDRLCPTCGDSLYETLVTHGPGTSHDRRWIQCANCSGLMLVRKDGDLDVSPPSAVVGADGKSLSMSFELTNRGRFDLHLLVVGLGRRGALGDAVGPLSLVLGGKASETVHVTAPLQTNQPGVISYRLLVLCEGALELLALKHIQLPEGAAASRRQKSGEPACPASQRAEPLVAWSSPQ